MKTVKNTWGAKNLRGTNSSWRLAQNSQEIIWDIVKIQQLKLIPFTNKKIHRNRIGVKILHTFNSGVNIIRRRPSWITRTCSYTLSWTALAYSSTIIPEDRRYSCGMSRNRCSSMTPLSNFIWHNLGSISAVASAKRIYYQLNVIEVKEEILKTILDMENWMSQLTKSFSRFSTTDVATPCILQ